MPLLWLISRPYGVHIFFDGAEIFLEFLIMSQQVSNDNQSFTSSLNKLYSGCLTFGLQHLVPATLKLIPYDQVILYLNSSYAYGCYYKHSALFNSYLIYETLPLRMKIMPDLGPRSVLCVVVVTMSQNSNGLGMTPAATSPLTCAISANK